MHFFLGSLVRVDNAVLSKALVTVGVPYVVAQPGRLAAPVDGFIGLPGVRAAASEAECLETHGLERHVARENYQIGPRDLLAVLLLDGPEQAAGLVQADVVRPAVEGCKTLLTLFRVKSASIHTVRRSRTNLPGAATAVKDAVGARAVPGHADEEAPVVAKIGGATTLASQS